MWCCACGLLYKRTRIKPKDARRAQRVQKGGAQRSNQHSQLSRKEIPNTTKMTVGAPTGKTMIEMCGTGCTGITHKTLRTSSSVALTWWALALCTCRLWSTPSPPNNTQQVWTCCFYQLSRTLEILSQTQLRMVMFSLKCSLRRNSKRTRQLKRLNTLIGHAGKRGSTETEICSPNYT